MKGLVALYPRAWRHRYGVEFAAMLDAQPPSPALIFDIVLGAIDAHLDPQVAEDGEDPLRRRMKEVVMDVGRWWAPLSFIVAWPIFILSTGGNLSAPAEIAWTTMMAMGWAAVCLVGVGIRVLIARSSWQLRDRPA